MITQYSKNMERFMVALNLCRTLHANQTDKCGQPYWIHPYTVAMRGFSGYGSSESISNAIVGLLHDIPEDTGMSVDALATLIELTEEEQMALNLLTHSNGASYDEYINGICESNNRIAISVKLDDLLHNMNLNRFTDAGIMLTDRDEIRHKNYRKAFDKLHSKLTEEE
jgi:(p)ppGpp synthase/HD superfamily hydrolase